MYGIDIYKLEQRIISAICAELGTTKKNLNRKLEELYPGKHYKNNGYLSIGRLENVFSNCIDDLQYNECLSDCQADDISEHVYDALNQEIGFTE